MEQKIKVKVIKLGNGATAPTLDAYDLLEMFVNNEEQLGLPGHPINDTVVLDIAEDNQHLELHLDKHFLDRLQIDTELTVKRFAPNKQVVTLDGAEVSKLKGLKIEIEFEYEGNLLYQTQTLLFPTVQTNAVAYLGQPIPNPAKFSDLIVPQYNPTTNEVSLQTTGSLIPTIMTIKNVKGIL